MVSSPSPNCCCGEGRPPCFSCLPKAPKEGKKRVRNPPNPPWSSAGQQEGPSPGRLWVGFGLIWGSFGFVVFFPGIAVDFPRVCKQQFIISDSRWDRSAHLQGSPHTQGFSMKVGFYLIYFHYFRLVFSCLHPTCLIPVWAPEPA